MSKPITLWERGRAVRKDMPSELPERPPVRTFNEVLVSRAAAKRLRQVQSAISESAASILNSGLNSKQMASKLRQSVKEFADAAKDAVPK